jgi:hypothetical protein
MQNMPQRGPQRPTYPAHTDSVPGLIRGVVVGMQPRIESQGRGVVTIWDFRLERHDAAGNPMPRTERKREDPMAKNAFWTSRLFTGITLILGCFLFLGAAVFRLNLGISASNW